MNPRSQCKSMTRGAASLALFVTTMLGAAAQAQTVQTIHVHDVVRAGHTPEVGRLPQTQTMRLDLVLPVRDREALAAFARAVSDPQNPSYRHYLSVPEFTARFGPTAADYEAVVAFAGREGLAVVGGSRDAMSVQVEGKVADIERAFHVDLKTYHDADSNRVFYSVDREPTTTLSIPLWHVSGLDNYSVPQPMLVSRDQYAAAHGLDPQSVAPATTGSGPSGSFLGSDMRAAYYGGTKLTGKGQNLGLFEYLGTDLDDLATYFKNIGQTNNVPITLVSTDGSSTACLASAGCDDTEQTLDMTQALGMAPGLASLTMYIGNLDTAIIGAMTTHDPLPTTIGVSWHWKPTDPTTLDPYFQKMAAQGQSIFVASGDTSTWVNKGRKYPWPADDAYVISVGGTDLATASGGGAWASETAWVNSGGGVSTNGIAIPSWQQLPGVIDAANQGSTTLRNGPDVAANANNSFYTCADQTTCQANVYGGTSFAAPMWAGFAALANELAAFKKKSPVGFINPTIYQMNLTSSYGTDFHDITSGTSGSYQAVTGYDLVTGWGSPRKALIKALVP